MRGEKCPPKPPEASHGSHGGVTKPEVEVPLVFGSVLMQRPLKPDPDDLQAAGRADFNIGRIRAARDAVRGLPTRAIPSNSDMTPILLEAIQAVGGN